jgi:hypothetical protein
MFNIFKKKQLNLAEKEEVYTVDIYFKDGKINRFSNNSKTFPYSYRKFYNWYFNRNSESYCFQYINSGMLIFNRNDISRIVFRKENRNK